ncbi:hypothetical protein AYJ54_25145 [Bradyrhizobium centrolobii]|uniref:Uncharacterized protein n=1 Tax=Bradyrhizobium centrolobii TaxID=1505087 RepID=A0A176YDF8_9BRAD|nr:hypothetical protein AYJ54_25145 [Bradyrhizobium centrolobii]
MKDDCECNETDAAERRAHRIERCRLLSTASPAEPGFFFRAPLVAFDQRRAGAKDGGKGEEEPPTDRPKREPITPARTVTSPPSTKRTAYSYQ